MTQLVKTPTFGTGLGLVGSNRYDAIKVCGGTFRPKADTAVPSVVWESAGDDPRDSLEKHCSDSRGEGVFNPAAVDCGISTARLTGLLAGLVISNAAEFGEKASKAERLQRERSEDWRSTNISGEYRGSALTAEWGESCARGKCVGDEDRARADQVLPLEGTVNGAKSRVTVSARGVSRVFRHCRLPLSFAITRPSKRPTQRTYVSLST